MPNTYTIRVINNSGAQQKYAFFTEKPQVTGRVQGQIWQNVFASAGAAPSQTAVITVYQQYFAMCGSSQGKPADGVTVNVTGMSLVTLGSKARDGTQLPGTTLPFTVIDEVPQFGAEVAKTSYVNAYQVNTDGSFTVKDAQNNNYVIGLGGSSGGGRTGPAVTFMPEPNVQYQIQPSNTYWVTFGDYKAGNIIDVLKVGMKVPVDFTQLPNDVTVIHDENGNLTVQK